MTRRWDRRRFFWMPYQGLAIYGVERDSEYEEDWPILDEATHKGYVFGEWFSVAEPTGEWGSNHESRMVEIEEEDFEAAKARGWEQEHA